jgi:hypothetical protein
MTAKRKPAVRAQGGLSISFRRGGSELLEHNPNSRNFQQIARSYSSEATSLEGSAQHAALALARHYATRPQ